jgi:hypothetical protein
MTSRQDLTPEERARITEIQDLLLECFVEHKKAIESGERRHAKELEEKIDDLQREKAGVKEWATVGSA